MVLLAQQPPANLRELAKVPGLGQRFARRWGTEVVRRLRRPRKAPPRARNERNHGPNAAQRRRIDALTEARNAVAKELGLPPGLVCPKAMLTSVATSPAGVDGMTDAGLTGWRHEVLARPFAEVLVAEDP
jgi:ribonuclease D